MERSHNSLIGFAKIHLPSHQKLAWNLSIFATFCDLNPLLMIAILNFKILQVFYNNQRHNWFYIDMADSKVLPINFLPALNKTL